MSVRPEYRGLYSFLTDKDGQKRAVSCIFVSLNLENICKKNFNR